MENNETWRERLRQIIVNPRAWGVGDKNAVVDGGATAVKCVHVIEDLFASELLTLADKIGAEKTKVHLDKEGIPCDEICWCGADKFNSALDTAISLIKEMAK